MKVRMKDGTIKGVLVIVECVGLAKATLFKNKSAIIESNRFISKLFIVIVCNVLFTNNFFRVFRFLKTPVLIFFFVIYV